MKSNSPILPPFLKPGDAVSIISPSGNISEDYLTGIEKRLQSWGLIPIRGEFAAAECGRYAGTVAQRSADLQEALDNTEIKAVFCSRGGYGCVHLPENTDWSKFRQNPKWIIGYSDITALHLIAQYHGVASLHAPMAKHLTETSEDDIAGRYLYDMLFGKPVQYQLPSHYLNRNGKTSGILRGGNLSVLCGLRGTRFDIVPENTILFLEDVDEKPYQVDRMMYNLKLGGILEKLSGLIIGRFTGYEEDPEMPLPLRETIAEIVSNYDFPVCYDFPVGHVTFNLPMLCGGGCEMEVSEGGARITQITRI